MLRIRTQRGMIELADTEANELRERLRRVPSAQPAEETIAVSTNASTSVTFTRAQEQAVLDVLAHWLNDVGRDQMPDGAFALRNALIDDSRQTD